MHHGCARLNREVRPIVLGRHDIKLVRPTAQWPGILVRPILWVGGCTGLGVLLAAGVGEFGSVVYVGVGLIVGVSGALVHTLLGFNSRWRGAAFITKASLLSACTAAAPAAWVSWSLWRDRTGAGDPFAHSWLLFYVPIIALSIIGAIGMLWYDHRKSA